MVRKALRLRPASMSFVVGRYRFSMAPIRYSLHYEDYSEHLMSRFGKLLQMQSLVDMTLMCSSHTLRVHKAVLAASSAYFQEVLQKQTGEPLIILKMRFSVLKCLVEFMYCGKTQCLEENLDDLVSAAQFLKIKGLSKVTKEGLGIANHTELPVFTPPVVINRPPQSLIDLHSQDNNDAKQSSSQMIPGPNASQSVDNLQRSKDMVVRIPFDIENGSNTSTSVDYDAPRTLKPRRGRPSVRRPTGWDGARCTLGRATERALLRREQDSRKAIHQLKHLQTRHMQDYMDRVTLSQAVNSICGPESSNNYMNIDNDLMYMDQTVSSNVLDSSITYSKEHPLGSELNSSYTSSTTTNTSEPVDSGISTAMSQYVNALKDAGLPTDLPILFESGDGSYINVNEQVLLDMVQSSEIQYEVIEQPNIIEKVCDPSEIKSIDDLSKSIERGEMLLGNKNYTPSSNLDKDSNEYSRHEDAINSLNSILPDNLEPFTEQQNYVVLDSCIQDNKNSLNNVNNDFSCIDGDMQFFTKSMSDDVKKYYEEQQLNDARVMDHLCPTASNLETNFNISLLETKNSHENMSQQFNLNSDDMRRNEDCYDFELQLPQTSDFKEDALDCLISTAKQTEDERITFTSNELDKTAQERAEIIQDLMNIEKNIAHNNSTEINENRENAESNIRELNNISIESKQSTSLREMRLVKRRNTDLPSTLNSNDLEWDRLDINGKDDCENMNMESGNITNEEEQQAISTIHSETRYENNVIDLTDTLKANSEHWGVLTENMLNKENEEVSNTNEGNINSTLDDDIPYAVGLLPLKEVQSADENFSKRKHNSEDDLLDNMDASCLKRKVKYKKIS